MTEPDLVGLFVAPLETLGLEYMITGGVASVIYGDPRFTRDIDLILELREPDASGLIESFSPDDFSRPPLEEVKEEIRRPPTATSTSSIGTRPYVPTFTSWGTTRSMPGPSDAGCGSR